MKSVFPEKNITTNGPISGSAASPAGTSVLSGRRLPAAAAIPIVERRSDLPLSFAQERLWFLAQMEGGSRAYQTPRGFHLEGELDRTALRRALNQIVARHESLRTFFVLVDGRPVQRIVGRDESRFCLIEHDLRECGNAAEEFERLIAEEVDTSIDLETGPLVRGRLIRRAEQDHILLITIHHIVSDLWSFGVFSNELSVLYSAYAAGEADPLPELSVQYADYAVWQRRWIEGRVLREQSDYWKTALAGAPALLQLPTDHPRPARQDYSGGLAELALDEDLSARLKALGRRHGTTLYMTTLAGWAAVLARLSGQSDVVIGTPMANRRRVEIEGLIGFFVNALPLRLNVSGSLSVGGLLAHVRSQAVAAQKHQDIPFEQIVELVRPVRSLSHSPVFQVMFAWQNAPKGTIGLPGLRVSPLSVAPHASRFDLTLSLQQEGGTITGGLEYATALFGQATAERCLGYLRRMLAGMAADETLTVDRLPMLGEKDRRQILCDWNATDAEYPREKCVHELFEEQVERTPEAAAVVFEDDSLSYAELNRRANQLAHCLRKLGVKPDDRTAICVERGMGMVVGLLAILKAGGAYVPLDPAYPGERLRQILADAAPEIALVDSAGREALGADSLEGLTVLDLPGDSVSAWNELPCTNLDARESGLTSRHLAYVIYTSGSTGVPKGVMVEHGNVVNFLCSMTSEPGITAHDRLLAVTSVSFDIAGLELYLPLCRGAQTVVAGRATCTDPYLLQQALSVHNINIMQATPATWRALLESGWQRSPDLKVLCGGEALSGDLSARLPEQGQSAWNLYGPTETAIWSACARIVTGARPTIGRPIGNTRIYILDEQGEPTPLGVTGELYIGGAGVARGYWSRPEQTAERFVSDPFAGQASARMYKTGDLGRWHANGTIEFLGRNDFQVKIRGFRIELGEIESRLLQHEGIREAVVMAREDAAGDKRLVAYYTTAEQRGDSVRAETLRVHVATKLPEYMVPAAYVRLASLPLTPNGKVDRRALPVPEGGAYVVRGYEAPAEEIEEMLAGIWAEVLNLPRVGRHDNFFELGGHSLLAVRVVLRMRQAFGIELAIGDIFEWPTLRDLGRYLNSKGVTESELPPIPRASREEELPLSFAQERLWFLTQMEGMKGAFHLQFGLHLEGDLDRAALVRALNQIVARHEALRTVFALADGRPVQRTMGGDETPFCLSEHDLRESGNPGEELDRLRAEEADTAFDLETGPLIRGLLVRHAQHDYSLLIGMHHIVSDGWSIGVFNNELSALYRGYVRGEVDPLPELKIQYADYAVWQRKWVEGRVLQEQTEYWKAALDGAPALLQLPTDHPRPALQSYTGALVKFALEKDLTAALKALNRRHGATLYMTVLAGWAALLARLSGQSDVVIGTPMANRRRPEVEGLIGFFLNTLALRFDLSGSPTVGDLLQRVKSAVIAAHQHQDIPFEQAIARPARSLAWNPIFQVMFSWQNAPAGTIDLPGLRVRPLPVTPHAVSKFDLTLSLYESDNRLMGGLQYATALFEQATAQRWLGYFHALLRAMALDDKRQVDRLPLLPERERRQLLFEWNDTDAEYPGEKCVHQLLEERAQMAPDATAVVSENDRLSYSELNRRANQLAHYLRDLGVKPDDRVAICMDRSPEMIVAIFAVLKSGGAYVPLDPAYPAERLRFMLADSAPAALLTQSHLYAVWPEGEALPPLLDLSVPMPPWGSYPEHNPERASTNLTPEHLAYVIYTSGSAGTPRGVMIPHRSLCSQIESLRARYGLSVRDRILQFASVAFDISVEEIFGALCSGATLVLRSDSCLLSAGAFLSFCEGHGVSVVSLPTAFWAQTSLDLETPIPKCMRLMIVGGEAAANKTWQNWFHRDGHVPVLLNTYGPTETTVNATMHEAVKDAENFQIIGRPVGNTRIYILDGHGEPVPTGVTGELYIGGAGLARGYWNRPERTAERFVSDPFAGGANARMYKTGDLGRWLSNGTIEFLGRNDFQVKVRGFRIELGEIEARLLEHEGVREAVVIAREDTPGDRRLTAYYTTSEPDSDSAGAEALKAHVAAKLPEYMVPAAYVHLRALPLTPGGKLNRQALPAPADGAFVVRGYEAPTGEVEEKLAGIWAELLRVERVGRRDNFFELGGHSLLAVALAERMRQAGLHVDVRALFATPTLAELASAIGRQARLTEVPPNGIPFGCEAITPEMLPLVQLSVEEIERLVFAMPGGAANVQDIYPLAPLQEGFLFHHVMDGERDPYVLGSQMSFDNRERLDAYLRALQAVVDRHDVLRTAVMWEGLAEPVQVVLRKAVVPVEEVKLNPEDGDIAGRLFARFNPRHYRIDVRHAPLMRVFFAHDPAGDRWMLMRLQHHMTTDHSTQEIMREEIEAHLLGKADTLPVPLPFRNLVAQARLGVGREEHEAYFRKLLGDVEEPTAPFGLLNVRGDGTGIEEAHLPVEADLARRVRQRARSLGVSVAGLFHVAWAQVLARVSGREDVVFGTLLFGRMQGGAGSERGMGLFINMLPVRIRVVGEGAEKSVRSAYRQLAELLRHEHASPALARRCSAVRAPAPLFSALLNYVYSAEERSEEQKRAREGVHVLYAEERTNYPCVLTVDDLGQGFRLMAQVQSPIEPIRICHYMHTALASLVHALETAPEKQPGLLDVLPEREQRQVLYEWNATGADYPREKCVHELFEEQAQKAPNAVAVVSENESLSYAQLNRRANRLARYLRGMGVKPDDRVAICVERSPEMMVAVLAVLKAGGAYVPLDPDYPVERLRYTLEDSGPVALLIQGHLRGLFPGLGDAIPMVDLTAEDSRWKEQPGNNLERVSLPHHLAYVIYTSGSTGAPKGVMVEHANIARLFTATDDWFQFNANDVWTLFHSYAFDFSVWEIWGALLYGGRLIIVPKEVARSPEEFYRLVCRYGVTVLNQTPGAFRQLVTAQAASRELHRLRYVIFGGEALDVASLQPWYEQNQQHSTRLINMYGITETTVHVTYRPLEQFDVGHCEGSPIGSRIPDLKIYILDEYSQPVPVGVAGELYVGGAGVARGYLQRPELTAQRFVPNPFAQQAGDRIYKTGDVGRWLPDGTIDFLGRSDFQVKVRGFRIELGEIEARLCEYPGIHEAVVIAREDAPGDKRLIAYYVAYYVAYYTGAETNEQNQDAAGAEALRAHVAAKLPEYMVPTAFVRMEKLPLTVNGKLDRRALPAPEGDAYAVRGYEAPRGDIEETLAGIWAELLRLERVGRHDNFFELGGHSLLAVTLVDRMRRAGLQLDARALFATPTLGELASSVGREVCVIEVPPNLVPSGCEAITPEMLPLVRFSAKEIERLVSGVPGGAGNIQDIYPLAPLQEGILFHHVMDEENDPYVIGSQIGFDTRAQMESYLRALQAVVDRHDILRTAVMWEGLPEPVQVVWRKAEVPVEEAELNPAAGDIAEQLFARFNPRHYRIDVRQAPLLRVFVARDSVHDRWVLMRLQHHLTIDHSTQDVMREEIEAYRLGKSHALPAPLPFRNLVAQARLGVSQEEHESYFRQLLGDVEEPTAPFGLLNVQGDGTGIEEACLPLDADLARRVRERAGRLGVSVASLFHVAWAQVLARVSGREDVVFGTLLFGRMQGGDVASRGMGVFINTLPVRIRVGGEGAAKSVRRTHLQLSELLRHEHASLALAQRCSAVPAPAPLFSALLNYRYSAYAEKARLEDQKRTKEGMRILYEEERTNYPCTLAVDDLGQGFQVTAQVESSIEPRRICEYMNIALTSLVRALEAAPEKQLRCLEILPERERRQVLCEWNLTDAEYPKKRCVYELFEEQVKRAPKAVAVVFENDSLSYAELNGRANQLAHYLGDLGVKPDDRVAICVERSLNMVVSLLAILKAGGAYVPLDPAYPAERLRQILADASPGIALVDAIGRAALGSDALEELTVLDLPGDSSSAWEKLPCTNPDPRETGLTSRHLAYVIYTSGSTGVPKGVMVEHGNLVNFLCSMTAEPGITAQDRLLSVTSISFDIAGLELYLPLSVGARTVIAGRATCADPYLLRQALLTHNINMMQATPATWRALLESGWQRSPDLKILCGGEALSGDLSARLPEQGRSAWNLYGPTETTIWSACTRIVRGARQTIGRPIGNTQIYILNRQGEPAPVGVTGELYIGGAGVARGYWNRPEQTAERFVGDPFAGAADARMYKTGDLGRWQADGTIEFLGRNDYQVKVRGFRIELGEIEARLLEHEEVREVVLMAREDTPGDKRLVAYYTTDMQSGVSVRAEVRAEALRAHAAARLPEYMVPAAYVLLEKLPLTPNGKVDRRSLPAPDGGAYAARSYEAPAGKTEEILAGIWAEVLKLKQVGRHDNFFELGGHSLLAVRIISRLREDLRADVTIRDMFAHPVLLDLARAVEGATRAEVPVIGRAQRSERVPLSFAQQRLWFLAQMEGASEAYHIPWRVRLRGELKRDALRRALNRILARHEALRTTFILTEGEPEQRIAAVEHSSFELMEHDLSGHNDGQAELDCLMAEEARAPFDLQRGPLIRGRLIRLGQDEEEYALLITTHHIVSDGWSMGVLLSELSALYGAFMRGEDDPLPELKIQYADYAVWQRTWLEGRILREQSEYWKAALAGVPALLELPTDRPRPMVASYRGARQPAKVPSGLKRALKTLSGREGATLHMTMLAAFQVLLGRYAAQTDVVVGTTIAGRTQKETEPLIGMFFNMLALRGDLSGNPTFRDFLRRVRETALQAYARQELPFARVVAESGVERRLSYNPLVQVIFEMENAPRAPLELTGLQVSRVKSEAAAARVDLTLSMVQGPETPDDVVEYSTDLFDADTIERMMGHYRTLLEDIVANPRTRIGELRLLTAEERKQMVEEWNATDVSCGGPAFLHELFERQAAKTPNRPAVVFRETSLSYAELNQRANQLGRYLRKLGAGPEMRVGICVERSPEMVMALLGVLKAGAAYLPLDPGYPAERMRYMLQDAQAGILVTQERWIENLQPSHARVVRLDREREEIEKESAEGLMVPLRPENLAYIYYTSGSTGRPKGVAMSHSGIVNYMRWGVEAYEADGGEGAAVHSSIAVDLTLTNFLPLFTGQKMVLARETHGIEGLVELMQAKPGWSLLKVTPTHLALLNSRLTADEMRHSTRVLVIGADNLVAEPTLAWRDVAPEVKLLNEYGPTETVVGCSICRIGNESPRQGGIPIGKPIANITMYVLDQHGGPLPVGVPGELYIGGIGVARGYWGRPDLTAEKFVPDGLSGKQGARLYRTGDRVRFLRDGNLEFSGRMDHQVKIRGYRIEPGEVEAVLSGHPRVRKAMVVVREDEPGEKRLVAYVGAGAEWERLTVAELRTYIKERLPEYMVPSDFVVLEQLPVRAGGKIDPRDLPAPDGARSVMDQAYESPVGEIEHLVAGIWADLLRRERVGRHDNFFDLGGHSLLIHRAVHLLAQAGISVLTADLFEYPTPKLLANRIEAGGDGTPSDRAICIRKGGAGSPLFLAHEGMGGELYVRALSAYLDPAIPVYALPAQPADEPQLQTVEEMASRMVRMVRAIQPSGPYRIAGWSFGGLLAYEIAAQMIGAGEEVEFVGLLDTEYSRRKVEDYPAAFDDRKILFSVIEELVLRFLEPGTGEEQRRAFVELKSRSAEMEFNHLLGEARSRSLMPATWTDLTSEQVRQTLVRPHLFQLAAVRYSAPRLPIPVCLFRSEEERENDPFMGWRECLPGARIHLVPTVGTHYSMMRRPHIKALGQALSAAMLSQPRERSVSDDDTVLRPAASSDTRPGLAVWVTGFSGAGKTTICQAVHAELRARGIRAEILDGDEVRPRLSRELGFSKPERDENIRRIGFVARLLARNGVVVLVSAISPYRAVRDEIRADIRPFIEVFANAPLDVCERRDPKGLYKKARAGRLQGFTGVSDPYEPPLSPEVECRTDLESTKESVDKVVAEILKTIGV